MNELVAPHESLPHEYLAPCAEALRELDVREVSDGIE